MTVARAEYIKPSETHASVKGETWPSLSTHVITSFLRSRFADGRHAPSAETNHQSTLTTIPATLSDSYRR
jgi:hypothetical protein